MAARRTLRLIFEYEGRDVRLVSAERVAMTPLPSHDLEPGEGATGFWFEVRDPDERPLYRRITENPVRTSAEVLTEDRERPLAREAVSEPQGHFILHVPDLDEAATLLLVGSPPEDEPGVRAAEELGRFDLRRPPGRP
jgi:hypothetical protein